MKISEFPNTFYVGDIVHHHSEYKGKKYERKDGKIKYKGKWIEEGYKDFPWEKRAYKAGDAAVKKLEKYENRK